MSHKHTQKHGKNENILHCIAKPNYKQNEKIQVKSYIEKMHCVKWVFENSKIVNELFHTEAISIKIMTNNDNNRRKMVLAFNGVCSIFLRERKKKKKILE